MSDHHVFTSHSAFMSIVQCVITVLYPSLKLSIVHCPLFAVLSHSLTERDCVTEGGTVRDSVGQWERGRLAFELLS